MAQLLDLSKRFTQEQIENAERESGTLSDLPAGGYICEIIRPILHDNAETGKANIELQVDILEGEYKGYFQRLEDRYGFWGLRGWMSFKDAQIANFKKTCTAIINSNPGFVFNPFVSGGADVDSLAGKKIGVVIGKEEYVSNSGDIREKNTVVSFTETEKIKKKKFKVPALKKLKENAGSKPESTGSKLDPSFIPADITDEEIPYL